MGVYGGEENMKINERVRVFKKWRTNERERKGYTKERRRYWK